MDENKSTGIKPIEVTLEEKQALSRKSQTTGSVHEQKDLEPHRVNIVDENFKDLLA